MRRKVWETSHFLRLRWDGDALKKNYQPRLFHYSYSQEYPSCLSTFFLGSYVGDIICVYHMFFFDSACNVIAMKIK